MSGSLLTLLRGELRYHLRDRVTLVVMVLLPLVIYPLLLTLVGRMEARQSRKLADQVLVVAAPAEFATWVRPDDHLRVVTGALPEDLTSQAQEGELDPIVAEVILKEGGPTVRYLGNRALSREALKRIVAVVERHRSEELKRLFAALGIRVDPEEVVKVTPVDVASRAEHTGDTLGRIIPLVLVMLIMSGGIYTSLDLFAGEKERGTMETLLTTRVDRRDVVVAKFTVVGLFALGAGVFSLLGLWIGSAMGLGGEVAGLSVALDAQALLTLGVFVVPLVLELTAVLVVVSAYAPDFRTGQSLALPVLMSVAALAGVAALPDQRLTAVLALVPVANLALAARDLLAGHASALLMVLAVLASLAHAALALRLAMKLLGREVVLLGGSPAISRRARGDFGPEAIGLFFVCLVLAWFLGQMLQTMDMVYGTLITQVLLFVGPAVGLIAWLGQPLRPILGLKAPAASDLGWALVAGLSAPGVGLLALTLQEPFIPMPTRLAEEMAQALTGDIPLWVQLLTFALLPAVCEEILFRGAMLGLLERSAPPAIRVGLVAILFGLMHLAAPRVLPTAALGAVLGAARLRSGSVWTAVVIHGCNNGLYLWGTERGWFDAGPPPLGLIVVAAAVSIGAIWRMGSGARAGR